MYLNSMQSPTPLPLGIILNISEILSSQKCFLELETVLYIYPQLKKHFGYKFPTIAVIKTDQYDKYSKFMHTRERPFGSKDLFIIKDEGSHTASKRKTKCYMILGSKQNQQRVPKAFETLSHYVTLSKTNKLSGLPDFDGSCECYELLCEPQKNDESVFRSAGCLSGVNNYLAYSFHVALLAENFLKAINPSLVRLENYSGDYDLSIGYRELFCIFCSFLDLEALGDDLRYSNELNKDIVLKKTLKCSFEIIKDKESFTSFYQYLLVDSKVPYREHHSEERLMSKMKSWSRFWFNHKKVVTISLFRNVKDITIRRLFPADEAENLRDHNFILIDCSKSATTKRPSYNFIMNSTCFLSTRAKRLKNDASSTIKTHRNSSSFKSKLKVIKDGRIITNFPYYVILVYRNFLAEQLQSVDITAFDTSTLEPKSTYKKKRETKRSNNLKLKDLECQINSLLKPLASVRISRRVPQTRKVTRISNKVMTTIVNEVSKHEGLNEEQPLRLRVFQKHSDAVNRCKEIKSIRKWFYKNMRP